MENQSGGEQEMKPIRRRQSEKPISEENQTLFLCFVSTPGCLSNSRIAAVQPRREAIIKGVSPS
jgi:hypothetical protein